MSDQGLRHHRTMLAGIAICEESEYMDEEGATPTNSCKEEPTHLIKPGSTKCDGTIQNDNESGDQPQQPQQQQQQQPEDDISISSLISLSSQITLHSESKELVSDGCKNTIDMDTVNNDLQQVHSPPRLDTITTSTQSTPTAPSESIQSPSQTNPQSVISITKTTPDTESPSPPTT
ncbi:hypothetical protein HDU76_005193, partial [Blyttiomyces sp. JEL0837]